MFSAKQIVRLYVNTGSAQAHSGSVTGGVVRTTLNSRSKAAVDPVLRRSSVQRAEPADEHGSLLGTKVSDTIG
jgi:hypothetical protein